MHSSKQTKSGNRNGSSSTSKHKVKNKLTARKGEPRKRNNTPVRENSENAASPDVCESGCTTDLSQPGLCSALQLASEIQAVSAATGKVEELKLFQQKQLGEAIKQKAMKKANVPFTKHIFKDLVDLQISDEDIHTGRPNLKNTNFQTKKDPVFRLEDFYKPDYSTEVRVNVPRPKFEIEKIVYYNGLELCERLESLKNLTKEPRNGVL